MQAKVPDGNDTFREVRSAADEAAAILTELKRRGGEPAVAALRRLLADEAAGRANETGSSGGRLRPVR
jgi:hypothetical protein